MHLSGTPPAGTPPAGTPPAGTPSAGTPSADQIHSLSDSMADGGDVPVSVLWEHVGPLSSERKKELKALDEFVHARSHGCAYTPPHCIYLLIAARAQSAAASSDPDLQKQAEKRHRQIAAYIEQDTVDLYQELARALARDASAELLAEWFRVYESEEDGFTMVFLSKWKRLTEEKLAQLLQEIADSSRVPSTSV